MTQNAVIQFQRANNLEADGEVGPETSTAIDKKLQSNGISTSSKTYTVKRGDSLWSIA
jgi:peptidoglycan hydrolase-like protein with peptidoglycan-binding domain